MTTTDFILLDWQTEYDELTLVIDEFDETKPLELLGKQSSYIDKAGECLCLASKQYNNVKFLLETTEAKAQLRLRRVAEDAGKKTTEKTIEAEVTTDAEVISVKRALMTAEDIKDRWKHRKGAVESRGRDLHDIVELITCGYAR